MKNPLPKDPALMSALTTLIQRVDPAGPRVRFARRLVTQMRARRITAPMLGQAVGANRTTVLNWMAGRKLPHPRYYKPLCKALKVRHADLILD